MNTSIRFDSTNKQDNKQRRQQQQRNIKEDGTMMKIDYMSLLPDDLITFRILGCLDAHSLLRMRQVNSKYKVLASSDPCWETQCQHLWRNKIHVCREATVTTTTILLRSQLSSSSSMTTPSSSSSNNNNSNTNTITSNNKRLKRSNSSSSPTEQQERGDEIDHQENIRSTDRNDEIGDQDDDDESQLEQKQQEQEQEEDRATTERLATAVMTQPRRRRQRQRRPVRRPLSRMDAYRVSIQDAKERQYVRRHELCFDDRDDDGDTDGGVHDDDEGNNTSGNHSTSNAGGSPGDKSSSRSGSRGGGGGGIGSGCGGTIWRFRFKESAGTDWTSVDPWFSGLPARKFVFLKNGTVKQYIEVACNSNTPANHINNRDDGQRSGGGFAESVVGMRIEEQIARQQQQLHQLLVPPTFPQEDIGRHYASALAPVQQQRQQQQQGHGRVDRQSGRGTTTAPAHSAASYILVDPPLTMTWRFLTRPMDLPTRPIGSYLRLTVGGRDVPTYSVRRSPTGNWGFVMESCWGLYASFELPLRPGAGSAIHPVAAGAAAAEAVNNHMNNHAGGGGGGGIPNQPPPPNPNAAAATRSPTRRRTRNSTPVRRRRVLRRTDGGVSWRWIEVDDDDEENDADVDEEATDSASRTSTNSNDSASSAGTGDAVAGVARLGVGTSSNTRSSHHRHHHNNRRRRRHHHGGRDDGYNDPEAEAEALGVAQLQDDSSLLITNEVQWREAFLYNVGARVLPEGDEATDEFDRAWGGL